MKLYVATLSLIPCFAFGKPLEITFGVLQPNLAEDTEYSPVYRMGFEGGLFLNLGLISKELSQCGYTANFNFSYYPHEDQTLIRDKAQTLEKDGAWVVFGPDRSNHFLAAAKGIQKVPLISAMANAKEVTDLSWPYFTMYPSNKILAEATYSWVKSNTEYQGRFGAVNDPTCKFCSDFLSEYQNVAGKAEFIYDTTEDTFLDEKLAELISSHKIKVLVLPVYSAFSGKVISSVKSNPNIRFIGSSGWGDELDHVPKYPIDINQKGFSVRLGPDKQRSLEISSLNNLQFKWNSEPIEPPDSVILYREAFAKITRDICKHKPKNRDDFLSLTKKWTKKEFTSKLGYGVFELNGKKYQFKRLLQESDL